MKIGKGANVEHFETETRSNEMPFGKYRGKLLKELHPAYIRTLLQKCDWIDESLKERLEEEYYRQAEELPCFRKLFDPNNPQCAKCTFLEECGGGDYGDVDSDIPDTEFLYDDWGDRW